MSEYTSTSAPMEFRPGCLARLKSGGPLMTVRSFYMHGNVIFAETDWFVGDEPFRDVFVAATLKYREV